MKSYKLNIELLGCLPELMETTIAKIAAKTAISQPAMTRYITRETVIPVQVLMDLCNAFRIPIYLFISEDGMSEVPTREQLTIPENMWQPIRWDYDAIDRIFGAYGNRIYWMNVAAAMNTSSQKAHSRFALKTRFQIDDFLTVCNTLQISPYRFLLDYNKDANIPSERKRSKANTSDLKTQREIMNLRTDIEMLKRSYSELAGKLNMLCRDLNMTGGSKMYKLDDTIQPLHVAEDTDKYNPE